MWHYSQMQQLSHDGVYPGPKYHWDGFFWLKAIQLGISYMLFMMMLGLKIDILNEKTELMVPGEGVVDHWWCGGIHRVQPGMIKLFRRTAAAGL